MAKSIPTMAQRAATRAAPETRPPNRRSAVTNGSKIFIEGKHTGPWARRFRDLIELHERDVAAGGSLTQAQRSLCRRCAAIEVELERMEAEMSTGKATGLDMYGRLTGTLARSLKILGIKSVAQIDVLQRQYDDMNRFRYLNLVSPGGATRKVVNEVFAPFLGPDPDAEVEDEDETEVVVLSEEEGVD